MEPEERQARRDAQRHARIRRRRLIAAGGLAIVVAAVVAVVVAGNGGGGSSSSNDRAQATVTTPGTTATLEHRTTHKHPTHQATHALAWPASTAPADDPGTGNPGHAKVPILMYHVIAARLPGAPFPGLYVPAKEFAEQMQALKQAGWHAVTHGPAAGQLDAAACRSVRASRSC